MAVYSIKELENLSGIKAHTIRIWEKRYQLIKPLRTNTNIRYYTDKELKKILNVAVLNRNGIKISNIARLSEKELRNEILRVSKAHPSFENTIDELSLAMIDMDEQKFNSLFNKAIIEHGFMDSIIKLAYPFLEKVGILWQTGDVNPAQEHFVTYLIRQKIIAAIDNSKQILRADAETFLLFLPEGEWHEIGLLFANYLIKEAGHKVIYLGQSVPYSDVLATGSTKNIDHILLSYTTRNTIHDLNSYLQDLAGAYSGKSILFMNDREELKLENLQDQVVCIRKIEDLTDRIDIGKS